MLFFFKQEKKKKDLALLHIPNHTFHNSNERILIVFSGKDDKNGEKEKIKREQKVVTVLCQLCGTNLWLCVTLAFCSVHKLMNCLKCYELGKCFRKPLALEMCFFIIKTAMHVESLSPAFLENT